MSVLYESVSCVWLILSDEPVLFCIYVFMSLKMLNSSYVWLATGKMSCKHTELPSVNKGFEFNWIGVHTETFQSQRSEQSSGPQAMMYVQSGLQARYDTP